LGKTLWLPLQVGEGKKMKQVFIPDTGDVIYNRDLIQWQTERLKAEIAAEKPRPVRKSSSRDISEMLRDLISWRNRRKEVNTKRLY
jgi:hypothetical protein